MNQITPALPAGTTLGGLSGPQTQGVAASSSFLDAVNGALTNVSNLQSQAVTDEGSFAAGVPGASLGKALVSSDRAEVAWSATVAVRDEVVSAYQSIMNMQF